MLPTLLLTLAIALAPQGEPSMKQAEALVRSGKWAKAAEAYEKILAKDQENGEAWFQLGTARHGLAEWAAASAANMEAARFPAYRATALYNAACAQSLGGAVDEAHETLGEAIEAGFIDFDLMASDKDLVPLRERYPLDLPKAGQYAELKARNGVRVPYRILASGAAEAVQGRPILVCFAPGTGPLSTDWMIEHFFGGVEEQEGWIVVALVAPEGKGWYTHPSHHALEELLGKIQNEYKPAGGKFHLFGALGGCSPALTYLSMSAKYFQSVTLASHKSWQGDDGDLGRFRNRTVHLVAGEHDEYALAESRRMQEILTRGKITSSVTSVPESGLLLEGWSGAELLADLSAHLLPAQH